MNIPEYAAVIAILAAADMAMSPERQTSREAKLVHRLLSTALGRLSSAASAGRAVQAKLLLRFLAELARCNVIPAFEVAAAAASLLTASAGKWWQHSAVYAVLALQPWAGEVLGTDSTPVPEHVLPAGGGQHTTATLWMDALISASGAVPARAGGSGLAWWQDPQHTTLAQLDAGAPGLSPLHELVAVVQCLGTPSEATMSQWPHVDRIAGRLVDLGLAPRAAVTSMVGALLAAKQALAAARQRRASQQADAADAGEDQEGEAEQAQADDAVPQDLASCWAQLWAQTAAARPHAAARVPPHLRTYAAGSHAAGTAAPRAPSAEAGPALQHPELLQPGWTPFVFAGPAALYEGRAMSTSDAVAAALGLQYAWECPAAYWAARDLVIDTVLSYAPLHGDAAMAVLAARSRVPLVAVLVEVLLSNALCPAPQPVVQPTYFLCVLRDIIVAENTHLVGRSQLTSLATLNILLTALTKRMQEGQLSLGVADRSSSWMAHLLANFRYAWNWDVLEALVSQDVPAAPSAAEAWARALVDRTVATMGALQHEDVVAAVFPAALRPAVPDVPYPNSALYSTAETEAAPVLTVDSAPVDSAEAARLSVLGLLVGKTPAEPMAQWLLGPCTTALAAAAGEASALAVRASVVRMFTHALLVHGRATLHNTRVLLERYASTFQVLLRADEDFSAAVSAVCSAPGEVQAVPGAAAVTAAHRQASAGLVYRAHESLVAACCAAVYQVWASIKPVTGFSLVVSRVFSFAMQVGALEPADVLAWAVRYGGAVAVEQGERLPGAFSNLLHVDTWAVIKTAMQVAMAEQVHALRELAQAQSLLAWAQSEVANATAGEEDMDDTPMPGTPGAKPGQTRDGKVITTASPEAEVQHFTGKVLQYTAEALVARARAVRAARTLVAALSEVVASSESAAGPAVWAQWRDLVPGAFLTLAGELDCGLPVTPSPGPAVELGTAAWPLEEAGALLNWDVATAAARAACPLPAPWHNCAEPATACEGGARALAASLKSWPRNLWTELNGSQYHALRRDDGCATYVD